MLSNDSPGRIISTLQDGKEGDAKRIGEAQGE
jgi:hypothetical protein